MPREESKAELVEEPIQCEDGAMLMLLERSTLIVAEGRVSRGKDRCMPSGTALRLLQIAGNHPNGVLMV